VRRPTRRAGTAGCKRESIRAPTTASTWAIDMQLYLLSGGAAKGLVDAMQPAFTAATGRELRATFSAVGAMRDKLLAGEVCDVVILTAAIVDALARDGHVVPQTVTPLGAVPTGVAVRAGAAQPDVSDGDALRRCLLEAAAIYVPDTERSTAGIHVVKVLRSLGVDAQISSRLRTYPNGATAMRELAHASEPAPVGITQVSEIIATPGVDLVAVLPPGFGLATVYAAAVCTSAGDFEPAHRLVRMLASPDAAAARARAGFQ
jgi:molybdate transport system substrate-binding protein